MTRMILVRHCEAQGNTMGVFQGNTDCDIAGSAEAQLDLLSIRCRNMPIDAIYSSPLQRAYKTAQAVNRFHNLPIHTEPRLREIGGGVLEGQPWEKMPELFPAELDAWLNRPWDFAPSQGEPMREVYRRVWEGVMDIVRQNQGKTVCVVSHGCAIRNILCNALHKPIEEIGQVAGCANTAISVIDFDENLRSTVVSMNDASHLTPEVSSTAKFEWWKQNEEQEPEKRG
ncbi:histidine phosphatase family protein [Caproiciproducens faecalis]|uniref:Histidine phosphatase family protein n=1 Tax=Caproiciproducens faecalis TaxID=2820301 RepID=A0ABS7DML9_9FIRM|nr:histidine phosphatase family protein [Caproiciproducens faecalis]MBW7572532.1 histidine phosphatase family protein [Caproiciproducens faecalis]